MKPVIKFKLIIINIVIFAVTSTFCGCWDRTELNQIALVMGIGIDIIPDKEPVQVTLEVVSPRTSGKGSDQSGKGSISTLQTGKGKTVFDAVENLLKSNSVKLDFSHNLIVILSKEVCKKDTIEYLDYIRRNIPFRMTSWILVSNDSAKEIMESKISNEEITSNGIYKMMNIFRSDGYLVPVILNEYFVESLSVGKSSYLPVIDIEKSENGSGKIKIENMAILKNDHLVGILTNQESRVLVWLLNKHKGSTVVFPYDSKGNVTLEVAETLCKIVPYKSNGEFRFKIICKGSAYLREMKNMKLEPESMKEIEQNARQVITDQFTELIDRSQKEFDTDFIGFSKAIQNEAPQEWFDMEEKWDEIYPQIKYEIDIKVDLTHIGIINESKLTNDEKEENKR